MKTLTNIPKKSMISVSNFTISSLDLGYVNGELWFKNAVNSLNGSK